MIKYEVVNMFTTQPSGGSPLAVVPRAGSVPEEDMPAIAGKLDVVEVSFVLPPTSPLSTYRVRVFTATGESQGGSHASLGTAATLVRLGIIPGGHVVQECGKVRQLLFASGSRGTHFGLGHPRVVTADPVPMVDAAGLTRSDLADAAPRRAGFGTTFPMLPVQRTAVARARPDYARMRDLGLAVLLVFHWEAPTRTAHARLFAPGFGIPEDPACSPVAAAFAAFLTEIGWLPRTDGVHGYTIRQGAEVGRPAVLAGNVTVWNGHPVAAAVTGDVVAVSRNEISSV